MFRQTLKNKGPAWGTTEIAIKKGKQFAKKYKVREDLVLIAIYLADSVFSPKAGSRISKSHEELSAKFAEKHLRQWKMSQEEINIILNSIRAHHNKVKATSKEAEVAKHADCFKFLCLEGILVLMHATGDRKMPMDEAVKYAKWKAKEKLNFISLPGLKKEAQKNYNNIIKVLDSIC